MSFNMSDAAVGFAREAVLAGDLDAAIAMLRAQSQRGAEADYWLASALIAAGEPDAATAALDAARTTHALEVAAGMGADLGQLRANADYAAGVATKLYGGSNVAMSSAVWALAAAAGHDSAQGRLTWALALQHQGRAEEAIAVLARAVERWPSAALQQFSLYPHLMTDDGARRFAAAAQAWAARWANPPVQPLPPRRPLEGRKLRIGYISPSFARTQIHQFIAPVLNAHDRSAVEVFLYPATAEGEDVWPAPTTVRPIGQLGDEAAAALIRTDELDVLADCWGHSAGSRLGVLARRCAPVQLGWINFVQTSGVAQIDYLLHADADQGGAATDPFTETVRTIGPVFNAFRASPDRLAPVRAPGLTTGQVTFGSFNHPCKLSDATLAAWAAILNGTPNGRLVLKYGYWTDPVLRRATQARFAGHGVNPERVQFRGASAGSEYFAAFREIDIALDPWPAPGSTTTLEALSNGVPVVALAPPATLPGLYTRSILGAVGLAELACPDAEAYVRTACALARDLPALDSLRGRVRPGFDNGPLADEAGFTRRLEETLRALAAETAGEQRRGAA